MTEKTHATGLPCGADQGAVAYTGTPTCSPCIAITERRQRAREAYWDADGADRASSCEAAIETATRVKLTFGIVDAGYAAVGRSPMMWPAHVETIIKAALTAAGFEVEQ